jgi:Flp pilus assembly protein TadG
MKHSRLIAIDRLEAAIGYRPGTRRAESRRGASAAELALLLPVLLFIMLGAIDLCRLFYTYTTITNAARNGAIWASNPYTNGTVSPSQSPYATLQEAAEADANGLEPALTNSDVTQSNGTDGNGDPTVSVTVQYQFKLLTSYLGFSTVSMARQVTMRVQPQQPN